MIMGQALEMCVDCKNKRGCDTCVDLHNWIMEHLDAEPVRYGEWIMLNEHACVCTCCHNVSSNTYYFCPECGAKMEKEQLPELNGGKRMVIK